MSRISAISVACHESMMLIRVKGLGSMNNSNGFYRFISEGHKKDFTDVCINLEDCDGMDSTFMGTLLLIHEETTNHDGNMVLINVSDYNRSKLDELGVGQFLDIGKKLEVPPELEYAPLPSEDDNNERMALVLRAHEELIKKNTDNEKKFGVFINSLKSSFK
ncbi:MAG: STAS domain-containing protein [Planctomycetes bacterium]|nr:STAS domain-containing protein [Planctomycetota bacterium]